MLSVDASLPSANKYWTRRRLAMYGFPLDLDGQADRYVEGAFSAHQSIMELALTDRRTGRFIGQTRRFRCLAENARNLPGFSGAPIVDIDLDCVVGVQGSYDEEPASRGPEKHLVLGTPLCRLQQIWPQFQKKCSAVILDPSSPPVDRVGEARLSAYRSWLKKQCEESVDLVGLPAEEGWAITLNHVYVPLTTLRPAEAKSTLGRSDPASCFGTRSAFPSTSTNCTTRW
jgi:hypothetical protein